MTIPNSDDPGKPFGRDRNVADPNVADPNVADRNVTDRNVTDPPISDDEYQQLRARIDLDEAIASGASPASQSPDSASDVSPVLRLLHECLSPMDSTLRVTQAERTQENWQLPNPFGRFEIRERIGQGAFGVVWKAYDPQLQRDVAIKVLHPELRSAGSLSQRFIQEARAAARLNHPNIVRVHDAGAIDGISYIAAEIVEGQKLETISPEGPRFNPRQAAQLIAQLADAIAHSHAQGVLHRDIKPDNVLLQICHDSSGTSRIIPRLTDFGLARIQDDDIALSTAGVMIGTVQYMSPEQLQGTSVSSGLSTDIYALGVLLYEMLTGTRPRGSASNVYQIIEASRSIASTLSINRKIPHDIDAICMRCLELNPNDRYSSADSLNDDLKRYLDGRPILARPLSSGQLLLRWCGLHKIAAAMISIAILSLSVAIAVLSWSSRVLTEQNTQLKIARDSQESAAREATKHETQYRHLAWISSIQRAYAFYEDSRLPAVAELMNELTVTHPDETARPEWQLLKHELNRSFRSLYKVDYPLREVVSIPNTNFIAFVGDSPEVHLMDIDNGLIIQQFTTEVRQIHALAINRDGSKLAIGGATQEISDKSYPYLIDLKSGQHTRVNRAGDTTIESLAFSDDEQWLATAYRYENAKLFPLTDAESESISVASNRRGKSILWRPSSHEVIVQADHEQLTYQRPDASPAIHDLGVHVLAFATVPNSNSIAICGLARDAYVLNCDLNKFQQRLVGVKTTPTSIAVSESGQWVAIGLVTGEVLVWNLFATQPATSTASQAVGSIVDVAMSSRARLFDGETTSLCWVKNNLIATSNNGDLVLWSPHITSLSRETNVITTGCFDPNNSQLVLGFSDGSLQEFDNDALYQRLQEYQPRIETLGKSITSKCASPVTHLTISRSGHWILATYGDGHLEVLERSGRKVAQADRSENKGGEFSLNAVTISDNDDWIAWGGDSNLLYVRQFDGANLSGGFTAKLTANIDSICFVSDGKSIAVSGQFEGVRIYDLATGKMSRQIGSSSIKVTASMNGSSNLITGSDEGVLRVIQPDSTSQRDSRAIRTSFNSIGSIAISPDDYLGISLSSTGVQVSILPDSLHLGYLVQHTSEHFHQNRIRASQFTNDNKYAFVLVGHYDASTSPLFRLYRLSER